MIARTKQHYGRHCPPHVEYGGLGSAAPPSAPRGLATKAAANPTNKGVSVVCKAVRRLKSLCAGKGRVGGGVATDAAHATKWEDVNRALTGRISAKVVADTSVWADHSHPDRKSIRTPRSANNQRLAQQREQCKVRYDTRIAPAQESSTPSHVQCQPRMVKTQRAPKVRTPAQGRESQDARDTTRAVHNIESSVWGGLRLKLRRHQGSALRVGRVVGLNAGAMAK